SLREHGERRPAEGRELASGLRDARHPRWSGECGVRPRGVRCRARGAGDCGERVAERLRRLSAHRWEVKRRLVAEAIGTFFLVLIGPGAAMVNASTSGGLGVTGIALAFAFVVIAMVYAFGHVSGAHINPAVTLAFWSARRFPAREVLPYLVAQCIGAT